MAEKGCRVEDLLNDDGCVTGHVVFTNHTDPLQDPLIKKGKISVARSLVMRKVSAIRASLVVVAKAKLELGEQTACTNLIVMGKCTEDAKLIAEINKRMAYLSSWTDIKTKLLGSPFPVQRAHW